MKLQTLKIEREEKRQELQVKITEINTAIEERDLETAKEVKALVQGIKERIKELDTLINEEESEEDSDETNEEENNEKEEINTMKTEERSVDGRDFVPEVAVDTVEKRSSFDGYLETRDLKADGLKLDEGYVVVPKDESKNIIELADDIVQLKNFVTVKSVSTGSGTVPVRTTAKAKLATVAELAESPALGVTPFTEIDYKVETKRAYIPYSEEYKQDGVNLVSDLKQFIGEVVVNTQNDDILTELNTSTAKQIKTLDSLKTLLNTGFSAGKKGVIKFVTSQTVFDNLDRVKDKNGRYILQESIASETGFKLLGKDIVVLDDSYFTSPKTMFVGDLKEIVYFDRSDVRVQWTSYLHFAECLGVAIRSDIGKVEDADTKVNIYKATVDIPTDYVEPVATP